MKYDIIIIGAGIVGLATALKVLEKRPDLKVLILDKEDDVAKHQTGNNSGVIHSGLYYKPGSLKATNCINGYHQMIEFCTKQDIPFELCGKIVVATSKEEIPLLNNLTERGKQNGLDNLKPLEAEELKEYEPHVAGVKGLFVPQTGIVDYTLVSKKYAELIKVGGGTLQLGEKVLDIKTGNGSSTVVTNKATYDTKLIVNCAGLYSDKVAKFRSEEH
ncbi:FAD-dependent oxidoreductase, partial [Fulvivirga sp.]|uniref:FAD-dependent oxidoreductase n=1 Tax=Fulvivirga sp. TaxID=1931237 RepID=UPI0032ED317A